jgi:hypothetical protein
MRFITKKEFDQALEVLELGIKNKQIQYGHHDSPVPIEEVVFIANGGESIESNRLSFVSPFISAQQQLMNTRNMLKHAKTQSELTSKAVEEFEKLEKQLAQLVPTLKE